MKYLVAVILFSIGGGVRGQSVVTATGLTPTEVQKAIENVSDGGTVHLPAGSATWTSGVTVSGKRVNIVGAGDGSGEVATVITHNIASEAPCFRIDTRGGHGSTLSHVGFEEGTTYDADNGLVHVISSLGVGWRLHRFRMENVQNIGVKVSGPNSGLIDNFYIELDGDDGAQSIRMQGEGVGSFQRGPSIGTVNQTVIEDGTFIAYRAQDEHIEGYYGARFTVRDCRFEMGAYGAHGLDSGSLAAGGGTHSVEFYRNTVVYTSHENEPSVYHQFRSGQHIIWGNRYSAPWQGGSEYTFYGAKISLDLYRANGVSDEYAQGQIDGTLAVDGNTPAYAHLVYHIGAINSATLSVAGSPFSANALVGLWLFNYADGSYGVVAANTPNTVTVVLTGGEENDFDPSDEIFIGDAMGTHTGSNGAATLTDSSKTWANNQWAIQPNVTQTPPNGAYAIWNVTKGTRGAIIANDASSITATLNSGSWDTGDVYKITAGYPARQQHGRGGPEIIRPTYTYMPIAPCYEWDNIHNVGLPTVKDVDFKLGALDPHIFPTGTFFLKAGRDFFNNTVMPGYVPLGVHPLRVGEVDYRASRLTWLRR